MPLFNSEKQLITKKQSTKSAKKIAIISGAGIAGLTTAIVLAQNDYSVAIVEKRSDFTRKNIINLDKNVEHFLKKYQLFDEFLKIAAPIEKHIIYQCHTDLQHDKPHEVSVESTDDIKLDEPFQEINLKGFATNKIKELFSQNGLYSVEIKDLQNMLAAKALALGVHILGNTEIISVSKNDFGMVEEVTLKHQSYFGDEYKVKPELLFISEGTHSTTAEKVDLGPMKPKQNEINEKWIFGNLPYHGTDSFVVSAVDNTDNKQLIANTIMNAKKHRINVAVLTNVQKPSLIDIKRQLYHIINLIIPQYKIAQLPLNFTHYEKKPSIVTDECRKHFSKGNTFIIGDAAGHSSPLAAMGGTLALTLIPILIENLLRDIKNASTELHENFNSFSQQLIDRWISKSNSIRNYIKLNFFTPTLIIEPETECKDLSDFMGNSGVEP